MTEEQREDLLIEWNITSTKIKDEIKQEYRNRHGSNRGIDHWEHYLVKALNLEQSWRKRGLL